MPAAAIRLSGVSHRYGAAEALADVSLELPLGATIGLVGPDGVGKSTLLGLISGVKKLQSGRVEVLGADMANAAARESLLPRIAYMPQGLGRNLYPTLSVRENIDFFGRLFGLDAAARAARIDRLLAATGLAPFPDRPAGKLSGGMKQKLGLCCALVHDPEILILDEPTTGVDPLSRQQFWALVESLRAESAGMTVLVSTAYMEEAALFEHLVAMDDGRVLACAPTAQVLAEAGTTSLEAAYVRLLPPDKRPEAEALVIPAWEDDGGAPAIAAFGLTRRFGAFTAVDNVSFRIGRGEIFGFLGSNGCGKTTTMKMLTGLLEASEGRAELLGQEIAPGDMATRLRIGYMSQAFSLYEELSLRANLLLHARLYRLSATDARARVAEALDDFDLAEHAEALPAALPLGIRQRLQLAAACLHRPEVLILDEPTSGVDPAARDMFWRHLLRLSRENRVTIFVSTHFMNEAERCDRISLMHRGQVLAVGAPADLAAGASLEEAFVAALRKAAGEDDAAPTAPTAPAPEAQAARYPKLSRLWAFAWREALELSRDPLRLAFALAGPIILLCIAALAISFDIEAIRFSVLDQDQSRDSRLLVEQFSGSRWFAQGPPARSPNEAESLLKDGRTRLIIAIPPGFGRDVAARRAPEIELITDGAIPFTAANVRAYASGVLLSYAANQAAQMPGARLTLPAGIAPRFIYNQQFKSIYAITPGVIMLAMILIPAMLTALGVVREKEIGSITNLSASPATVGEYLLGKQAPYAALALVSFWSLVAVTVFGLGVPLKGSLLAVSLGGALFGLTATAIGLLISCFVRTQVAAIFGAAILCLIPSVNFSGLLYPVSTMTGASWWVGQFFPSSWFQLISLGAFTKGLGLAAFPRMYGALLGFALAYMAAARALLRKQEV